MQTPGNEWYWAYWNMVYFGRPLEEFAGYSHDAKIAYIAAILVKAEAIKRHNEAAGKKH